MVINWTNPAIKDLKSFLNYTKIENPSNYIETLVKQIDMLTAQPKSGKIYLYTNNCIVRQIIIDQHKVLYYVNNETIHILSVIHFKQNIKEKIKYIKQYLQKF